MSIIQHAVWLYHRFPLSYRDVQELLHQRGIEVSHETLREWCIKFSSLFAEELRHREPRRGSRWYLDEVCTSVDGIRHWLWRAVNEHGFVLDIFLQRHRDTEAAKAFLPRLLGEYGARGHSHRSAAELWCRNLGTAELGQRRPPAGDFYSALQQSDRAAGKRRHRRCSAQDSLIVLHGVKSDSSLDSSGGNERRNF